MNLTSSAYELNFIKRGEKMRAGRHDRLGGQGGARVEALGAHPNMISLLFIVLLSETCEDVCA